MEIGETTKKKEYETWPLEAPVEAPTTPSQPAPVAPTSPSKEPVPV